MLNDESSVWADTFQFFDGCSSKIASSIMVVALLSFTAFYVDSTYPLLYKFLMLLIVLYAVGVSASLVFYSGVLQKQPIARKICNGVICILFICIVLVAVVFGVFTAGTIYDFAHPR